MTPFCLRKELASLDRITGQILSILWGLGLSPWHGPRLRDLPPVAFSK